MYKRVILKLSGEALGNDHENLDLAKLDALAEDIAEIVAEGTQIGIVVGGGNYVRGRTLSSLGMNRSSADYMGMLGTVMNALALQAALRKQGLKALAVSALDVEGVTLYNQDLVESKINEGTVIVFGGGIGNPYFSTDSTAALRACQLNAEIILMAKNGVDGVYNADPSVDNTAKRYEKLSFNDILIKNLKVIDATAAGLCKENHIKGFVFDMNVKGNIRKAIAGTAVGTLITED